MNITVLHFTVVQIAINEVAFICYIFYIYEVSSLLHKKFTCFTFIFYIITTIKLSNDYAILCAINHGLPSWDCEAE